MKIDAPLKKTSGSRKAASNFSNIEDEPEVK